MHRTVPGSASFSIRQLPIGDTGQRRPHAIIHCSVKGCDHDLSLPIKDGVPPIEALGSMLRPRGWSATNGGRKCWCPEHTKGGSGQTGETAMAAAFKSATPQARPRHPSAKDPRGKNTQTDEMPPQSKRAAFCRIKADQEAQRLTARARGRPEPYFPPFVPKPKTRITNSPLTQYPDEPPVVANDIPEPVPFVDIIKGMPPMPDLPETVAPEILATPDEPIPTPDPTPESQTTETPMSAAPELKVVPMTPPAVDTPRQSTPANRRTIAEFLDDVYNIDKLVYTQDWTDQKVAEKLNMPRAWVAEVRDFSYGPEGSEINELAQREIRAWIERGTKLETSCLELGTTVESWIAEGKRMAAKFKVDLSVPKS